MQNYKIEKRAFLLFLFLSICLWLIPFIIRIYFLDFNDIESLPKMEGYKEINAISQIKYKFGEGKKLNVFGLIFWNNLKVCILNIVGAVTFCVTTIISLAKNGFFLGDIIVSVYQKGMPVSSIIKHTLPHSIEIVGTWLSGAIGFSFSKMIIDFMRDKAIPNIKFIKFLGYNTFVVLLIILISAYIEVYVSMTIL